MSLRIHRRPSITDPTKGKISAAPTLRYSTNGLLPLVKKTATILFFLIGFDRSASDQVLPPSSRLFRVQKWTTVARFFFKWENPVSGGKIFSTSDADHTHAPNQ